MFDSLTSQLLALREAAGGGPPGFTPTRHPGVNVFWSDRPLARALLSYEPGLAVILSGRKTGFLDGRRFVYEAGDYLAVGLPVCFDCETEAGPQTPLLGVFLTAEPDTLQALASKIRSTRTPETRKAVSLGVEPLRLGREMLEAIERLALQLNDPVQASVLTPATLTEVFFHALRDRHGGVLLAQARPERPEARLGALMRRLDQNAGPHPSIDAMAAEVGMSSASFYRHFKAAFGATPLQYFKRIRLLRAQSLIVDHGVRVAEAAHASGYSSASQFSRDFHSAFGHTPSEARRKHVERSRVAGVPFRDESDIPQG